MNFKTITIRSVTPPTVEIDSAAKSAYVRFSKNQVVKTKSVEKAGVIIAIDLDKNDDVIGVELVGVTEFSVKSLLHHAPVTAPRVTHWENTKYVPSGYRQAGNLQHA